MSLPNLFDEELGEFNLQEELQDGNLLDMEESNFNAIFDNSQNSNLSRSESGGSLRMASDAITTTTTSCKAALTPISTAATTTQ